MSSNHWGSFLRDGVAVVSAKISEARPLHAARRRQQRISSHGQDVDITEYSYQNRFMFHAEVH